MPLKPLRVIEAAGRKGLAVPGDITDAAFCSRARRARRRPNSAGSTSSSTTPRSRWRTTASPTFRTRRSSTRSRPTSSRCSGICRAALEHLQPGAAIINTASEQAYQPSPHLLAYAATKAAIVNFTKNLGQQLIEQGIRVNAVAPGPVWTPLIPATMPPDNVKSFGQQAPIGRAAQPVELAPAYVFLASQEASYISGETIAVTGGKPLV